MADFFCIRVRANIAGRFSLR